MRVRLAMACAIAAALVVTGCSSHKANPADASACATLHELYADLPNLRDAVVAETLTNDQRATLQDEAARLRAAANAATDPLKAGLNNAATQVDHIVSGAITSPDAANAVSDAFQTLNTEVKQQCSSAD